MEGLLQCLDIKQLNLTVTQTLKNLTALNEEQDVKVIIHCCKTAVLPQIRVYRDCVKHIGRTIVADESFARNKEFLNNLFDFLCQVFLRVDTSFPIETSREMISVLCEIFVIVGNVCDRETAFLALDALMTLCIQPMNLCLKELKYKFTTNDSSPVVRDQHKPNLSVDVVCEIICCLCSEAKETCNVASYITNCLSHNNFQLVKRRLLDCLPTLNDRLIVKILIDVYPTCEVVDKIPIPYNDIWLTIMQYFKRNEMGDIEEKRSFVFVVLSCISDYLFPKMDVTSETLPIWINCRFWELLQCGLVHDNPLHRKRSIYFLKKVIEFLQNTSIEIPQSLCDGLFSWPREDQSRMAQKTFETICLILETTEEKQVKLRITVGARPVF